MIEVDVRKQHATWLALIESGGPFLTLPVLSTALSHGLDPVRKPVMDALRLAWSTWEAEQRGKNTERAQDAWVKHVVRELLDWQDDADFDPPPGKWEHTEPEYGTLTPAAFTLDDPDGGAPAFLGFTVPFGTSLTARSTDGWSASALDRVAVTLREHDIPLGLLSDGRWWGLVWAPRGGATAHALWDSVLWIEDRVTLEAFATLLGRRRTLGVAEPSTLLGMLKASLDSQEEVTDQLGKQVRAAVEMLVDSISRADEQARICSAEGSPGYLDNVSSGNVYEAAVTVLMRLVFMLAAEERRLLPVDDDLYARSYGISTLGDQLDLRAADEGEDALDHSLSAWQRLLAAFRIVHDGADHHDFRLPGYGGGLFDPDRYPWLEGRVAAGAALAPMPIDDRTVRRVVRSLMWLEFRDKGVRENRRVTYRALDVEQIGYVYEGLLDHGAVRAEITVLGFAGQNEPEIALDELTAQAASAGDGFPDWLGKEMGKPAKWVRERLGEPVGADARDELWRRVLAAVGSDERQARLVLPFARLLRDDQRALPVVIPRGRIYVTASSARGDTGTHYTPRTLAESVVAGALEPLVYSPGPLQTLDRTKWKIRSPETILTLKIADIAIGSGAFLVAACRYLADRLIEALLLVNPDQIQDPESVTLWFLLHDQELGTDTADEEADEALIHARRLIVERCLYGADINPLAVEMAKLSLWLITSAQHRPFSFLDHRLVAGDSLLGLTSLSQLEDLHALPGRGRALHANTLLQETSHVRRRLTEAADARRAIALRPSTDLREVAFKTEQLAAAERLLADLTLLTDALAGGALAAARSGQTAVDRNAAAVAVSVPLLLGSVPGSPEHRRATTAVEALVTRWLAIDQPTSGHDRHPVQWLTKFPEVFLGVEDPGFDAIVGNPPFIRGRAISGAFGSDYASFLTAIVAKGRARGTADFVAYFVLTAASLANQGGHLGLIATSTLAEGDTREASLDNMFSAGWVVRATRPSFVWPTRSASVSVCTVSMTRRDAAVRTIDERIVEAIGPDLREVSGSTWIPRPLRENHGLCLKGSEIYGAGFLLSEKEAQDLLSADRRYSDVVMPYISGQDIMERPDRGPSRWVINFYGWGLDRAAEYPLALDIVERRVKPERATVSRKARRDRWWQYGEKATGLYSALEPLSRAFALAFTSNTLYPAWVAKGQVYTNGLVVFTSEDAQDFGLIASTVHAVWAHARASTLGNTMRYAPADIAQSFPRPTSYAAVAGPATELDDAVRSAMLDRNIGATSLFELVAAGSPSDDDVTRIRAAMQRLNETVFDAYGWTDVSVDLGLYATRFGRQYTFSPELSESVLQRLLTLNQERHVAEQAVRPPAKRRVVERRRTQETSLFDEEPQ